MSPVEITKDEAVDRALKRKDEIILELMELLHDKVCLAGDPRPRELIAQWEATSKE